METKLKTKYDFKEVEKGQYETWVEKGYFTAGKDLSKTPFTVVIPPPNVTGKLHLGHAWDNTLQDIIIRRKRMQGYDALFLPGMDHAGIATQARVDNQLKQMGISRHDIGREKFLEHAWSWKEEYAGHIRDQWKALGLSLDYTKERFTLDDKLNDAVNYVFINLYEKGLIYRGNRIINWDPEAQTALSNIEVEHKETQGKLFYFKYPLIDSDEYLVVATTRPETMFADQAVMVHPKDDRYTSFIGKKVYIPGTKTAIPVIADDYVDKDFGTGVVKVTPAHDPNDFEVALRHHLDMPLCMEENGKMNHMANQYEGQDRFECRTNLVYDLEKLNLVHKIEDYTNSVGYSERTGVVVEPRLSLQWFIAMEKLAEKTLKDSKINYYPSRFKKLFDHWMENIQDWCISRQLWWGHRIPAWYKEGEVKVQVTSPGDGWHQDEDVLDTWFSSALWPFSTLGWPEKTDDFNRYYPTDTLVTGYDILTFWVSRMVFQALEFTDKDPFKDVLLHGLIRDSEGRKMSKSLNNGIDPMDVIKDYGVDTLRYFLTTNSAPGMDLRYEVEKVESSWNFINKLWNITRFITMNLDDLNDEVDYNQLTLQDKYILSRLTETINEADYNYEKYEFGEAAKSLYHFIWEDFANWYVEFAKIALQDVKTKNNTQRVLLTVLKAVLKLMHPFIPFVTEKLYSEVSNEPSIMISDWPKPGYYQKEDITLFEEIKDTITKVRNLRAENNVIPSKPLDIYIETSDHYITIFNELETYFKKFLGCHNLEFVSKINTGLETILLVGNIMNTYVLKSDLIDPEKEKETLLKQKETLENEIKRSEALLNNENFVKKAPEAKLTAEKEKYENYKRQYNDVLTSLKAYV